jgi:hypothetical protein
MEESHRQMVALTRDLSRSETPHRRERAASLSTHRAITEWPKPEDAPAHASRIPEICLVFYAGADLYSNYRVLSGYSRAGYRLAAAWLDSDGGHPRVREKPQEPLTFKFVGEIALVALCWSSRAFDDLVYKSPRSDFLDSIEHRTQLRTWLQPKSMSTGETA